MRFLSATVNAKERPFSVRGGGLLFVCVGPEAAGYKIGYAEWVDSCVGTHIGRFSHNWEGKFIISDTVPANLIDDIDGIIYSANGDQIFFSGTFNGDSTEPLTMTITGGTGRFKGAAGSYSLTIFKGVGHTDYGIMVIPYDLIGTGTIDY